MSDDRSDRAMTTGAVIRQLLADSAPPTSMPPLALTLQQQVCPLCCRELPLPPGLSPSALQAPQPVACVCGWRGHACFIVPTTCGGF